MDGLVTFKLPERLIMLYIIILHFTFCVSASSPVTYSSTTTAQLAATTTEQPSGIIVCLHIMALFIGITVPGFLKAFNLYPQRSRRFEIDTHRPIPLKTL